MYVKTDVQSSNKLILITHTVAVILTFPTSTIGKCNVTNMAKVTAQTSFIQIQTPWAAFVCNRLKILQHS